MIWSSIPILFVKVFLRNPFVTKMTNERVSTCTVGSVSQRLGLHEAGSDSVIMIINHKIVQEVYLYWEPNRTPTSPPVNGTE